MVKQVGDAIRRYPQEFEFIVKLFGVVAIVFGATWWLFSIQGVAQSNSQHIEEANVRVDKLNDHVGDHCVRIQQQELKLTRIEAKVDMLLISSGFDPKKITIDTDSITRSFYNPRGHTE